LVAEIPGQGAIHPPGTGATSGFTSIQVLLIGLPRLQLIQQTLRIHPMPQMWLHRGPSSGDLDLDQGFYLRFE
jgi:hypothetical protein